MEQFKQEIKKLNPHLAIQMHKVKDTLNIIFIYLSC